MYDKEVLGAGVGKGEERERDAAADNLADLLGAGGRDSNYVNEINDLTKHFQ